MREVLILGGARTPVAAWAGGKRGDGSPGGALKPYDPFDLGAAALKAALERTGVEGAALDRVYFSNVYAATSQAVYGARQIALRAGVPEGVPAITVGMACGSGLYAVIAAAESIGFGQCELLATGGADNSSLVPRAFFIPSFKDAACGEHIGKTVEDMAREAGLTRAEIDRWALESHLRARAAIRAGTFRGEIVPIGPVAADDAPLESPTPEPFAAAEPSFEGGSLITKMNSHAVGDAGAALVLASPEGARRAEAAPLGRYLGGSLAAVPPRRMGYASVPALKGLLASAGLSVADIDLFEINETFAAQLLIDLKELGIPESKVNVNGGAVALGHPFAATGPRQVLSLLLELKRRGFKRGAASICIGGGQGVAVLVETL